MNEPPQRDVTELVDVAARTFWDQSPQKAVSKQEYDDLPQLVKLDLREAMLPIVQAVMEKADGKPLYVIDPTIINDAVPVPDEQCGDYPAPCNCDDPFTHGGHK